MIIALSKNADLIKKNVDNISDVVKKAIYGCSVYEIFNRSSARPVASLPLSESFDDSLRWICTNTLTILLTLCNHIIDLHARFSEAAIILTKTTEKIVKCINKIWILKLGAPKSILTDSGGEFDKAKFRENAEFYGIRSLGTAANSPYSNCCCERHNAVLTETFLRVRCDLGSDYDNLCLKTALFAKKCLSSDLGFSPLVFGRLPRLPTVFYSELPALNPK